MLTVNVENHDEGGRVIDVRFNYITPDHSVLEALEQTDFDAAPFFRSISGRHQLTPDEIRLYKPEAIDEVCARIANDLVNQIGTAIWRQQQEAEAAKMKEAPLPAEDTVEVDE